MFSPPDIVRRRRAEWDGITADTVEITRLDRFEYGVKSPYHVLIVSERAERQDGETVVDGFQRSTQREFSCQLSFIPAGHCFYGWQDPRVLARCTFLYIDPEGSLADPDLKFQEIAFTPRLFFFDKDIWETALKLKAQVENPGSTAYAEALGSVLVHELARLERNGSEAPKFRGGLAGWQQKKVADYIEEHLEQDISLQRLAELAQLSRYHFARAFKHCFGLPPHRYHMSRRIERAKSLLEERARSVTEVGLLLGFAETSSFTTSFRRAVGVTPSEYRRALL
ncbi:MAG: helix-turn-helix transcriptional regulator [Xanthobacteraceae bacterium]|nr:helix-turn-helix transcriptional regulator [Xanthobacteraceae bacterium]